MKNLIQSILFFCLVLQPILSQAQEKTLTLSLNDVIEMANENSLDALIAKNSFRSSYWSYRSHRATLLPSLNMSAVIPDFNRSISQITQSDGSLEFVEQKNMSNYVNFDIKQNIPLTGGQLYVNTDLQRLDILEDSTITSYLTSQLILGYDSLFFLIIA